MTATARLIAPSRGQADGWHGHVEHAAGTPDPAAFPDDTYVADYLDEEDVA